MACQKHSLSEFFMQCSPGCRACTRHPAVTQTKTPRGGCVIETTSRQAIRQLEKSIEKKKFRSWRRWSYLTSQNHSVILIGVEKRQDKTKAGAALSTLLPTGRASLKLGDNRRVLTSAPCNWHLSRACATLCDCSSPPDGTFQFNSICFWLPAGCQPEGCPKCVRRDGSLNLGDHSES